MVGLHKHNLLQKKLNRVFEPISLNDKFGENLISDLVVKLTYVFQPMAEACTPGPISCP